LFADLLFDLPHPFREADMQPAFAKGNRAATALLLDDLVQEKQHYEAAKGEITRRKPCPQPFAMNAKLPDGRLYCVSPSRNPRV
jgi:hypothetical protein